MSDLPLGELENELASLAAQGGSAEPRHRPPSNAEALVAMADNALAHDGEGRPGGDRYQVVIHVEDQALREGEASCLLDDGPALAPETARRLACDASVVTLLERNGGPLSAGRKTRQIPLRILRALRSRDQGCRFPGCTNTRHLQAHHIKHWAHCCASDHKFRFHDRWGRSIPYVPKRPPGSANGLRCDNQRRGITPTTCKNGTGDPMELDLAVDELFRIFRQPP